MKACSLVERWIFLPQEDGTHRAALDYAEKTSFNQQVLNNDSELITLTTTARVTRHGDKFVINVINVGLFV